MDPITLLIIVAFVVGVPGALLAHRLLDRRRAEQMRRVAGDLGLEFALQEPTLESEAFIGLPLFQLGLDRQFLHVMRGRINEQDVLVFDYRHRVGGLLTMITSDSLLADAMIGIDRNRKPTYYNMTVVALRVPLGSTLPSPTSQLVRRMAGHTRVEADRGWLALYRFDRRVPMADLSAFILRATEIAHTISITEAA